MTFSREPFFLIVGLAIVSPTLSDAGIEPTPNEIGGQGVPGTLCPTNIAFTASDGCSTCTCGWDGRMTDCERSTCPEPRGNYTKNECVEDSLYTGNDGCNHCQCNAWRSFSWCTRRICLESLVDADTPTSDTAQPDSPASTLDVHRREAPPAPPIEPSTLPTHPYYPAPPTPLPDASNSAATTSRRWS